MSGKGGGAVLFRIEERITEDDFQQMETAADQKIDIDLSRVKFLTSKELSRLLILKKKNNKEINLLNANAHIKETIELLSFKTIFLIKS
jgi:anti-anti-sigma regulatory factor